MLICPCLLFLDIPYFKEVLLIAFSCPHCGYRTNEVKNGGGIPPKGKRITLINGDKNDLSRSFLKSETCEMEIKELDIKLTTGTLGSKFTTCEGILRDVYDAFANNPFLTGDSADPIQKEKFDSILEKLQMVFLFLSSFSFSSALSFSFLTFTFCLKKKLGHFFSDLTALPFIFLPFLFPITHTRSPFHFIIVQISHLLP